MNYIPMLCESTFYNYLETNGASSLTGSGLSKLPGTIMQSGGTAYHVAYEFIVILFVIAIICAILAVALSKSQKMGDAKKYLIKVCVVFICICAFGGFLGVLNNIASGWL